jgi:bifunctional non-homologous end joining protein LigD
VSIWDHGVYECEKWTPREVKVVLHGERAVGRFVLFPTKGKQWMIHRMDPVPGGFEPVPDRILPMLAVVGDLPDNDSEWAFEFKWDGVRALVAVDGGRPLALSRNGRDITASFPELRRLGEALGATQVLLDGELVAFGEDGKPSFSRLQRRTHVTGPRDVKRLAVTDPVSYVIFDLLHLDGRPLLDQSYDDRRRELDRLHLGGAYWAVTPTFTGTNGDDVLRTALEKGMEGVIAKRRSSVYRSGSRNGNWIKVKRERTQEVVVGGWTAGSGSRAPGFGALVLGVPDGDGSLVYVGKVGTGFSGEEIDRLSHRLRSLSRKTSPFGKTVPQAIGQDAHWVRPKMVGEVRFSEWTPEGRLRHPAWRGLRTDKRPGEVIREP